MSNMSRVAAYPPAMESTKIIGARIVKGMRSIQMKTGMKARLITSAAMFEM